MASFDYVGELKVSKSDAGREFLKQLDEKISDYIYGAVEYQDDYVVISIHELKDPEKNWSSPVQVPEDLENLDVLINRKQV